MDSQGPCSNAARATRRRYWPTYFNKIASSLAVGGAAVLQAITIDERRFALYRRRPDFIRRFLAAWPQIAPLGFDTRFKRMWEYYLAYCEVGFALGAIDVGQFKLVRESEPAAQR